MNDIEKMLLDEIKGLRADMNNGFEKQAQDHASFKKEFYLFKGKFTTISSGVMFLFMLFGETVKKKLGL